MMLQKPQPLSQAICQPANSTAQKQFLRIRQAFTDIDYRPFMEKDNS
jgi:hypothetical protein